MEIEILPKPTPRLPEPETETIITQYQFPLSTLEKVLNCLNVTQLKDIAKILGLKPMKRKRDLIKQIWLTDEIETLSITLKDARRGAYPQAKEVKDVSRARVVRGAASVEQEAKEIFG